ncbi:hypothetical protein RIF29_08468 [Crotalaria pallida]|uniref:Uncharacterized protein n=1 Tax=Crotalaria pallida TaxID=3830 RepID=A0AAN9FQT0_CROPI
MDGTVLFDYYHNHFNISKFVFHASLQPLFPCSFFIWKIVHLNEFHEASIFKILFPKNSMTAQKIDNSKSKSEIFILDGE